jgi:hypothetical protein
MKTLVIHPKDKSTNFLKPIYSGRSDMTIMNSGTKEEVTRQIHAHDHIIMCGHGTPQGLLGVGQFNKPKPIVKPDVKPFVSIPKPIKSYSSYKGGHAYEDEFDDYVYDMTTGYVINEGHSALLRQKKLTTIWCNADQFIEWNKLGGFYTGMFVSEVGEAKMIGLPDVEQWQVDESNYGFVALVRKHIDLESKNLYNAVRAEYKPMAEYNAVARYNYRRLYVAGESGNVRIQQKEVRPTGGKLLSNGAPNLEFTR